MGKALIVSSKDFHAVYRGNVDDVLIGLYETYAFSLDDVINILMARGYTVFVA